MNEIRSPYFIPITSGSDLPSIRLVAMSLVDMTLEQAFASYKRNHGDPGRVWHWEKQKLVFFEPVKVTYD